MASSTALPGNAAQSGNAAQPGIAQPGGTVQPGSEAEPSALRLIRAAELSSDTAQTSGMARTAAISGPQTGARSMFMGQTVMTPGASSGDHHHGESETGIFVVSGSPVFAFRDPGSGEVVRLEPKPGDFIWVPPHVPHREENPSGQDAVVVIARSTEQAIVVNLPGL